MQQSPVEKSEGSSDLRRNEGLLYPSYVSRTVVFHCTVDPMKPGRDNEITITHIPSFFVICSNWYAGFWIEAHPCLVHDSKGHRRVRTWYLQEPNENYIRLKCEHDKVFYIQIGCVRPALHSIWSLVSRAATVIASFWTPCVQLVVFSGSTHRSTIVTEENIIPTYQFSMIIEQAYSQLGNLCIHCITLMLSAASGLSVDIICRMLQWHAYTIRPIVEAPD